VSPARKRSIDADRRAGDVHRPGARSAAAWLPGMRVGHALVAELALDQEHAGELDRGSDRGRGECRCARPRRRSLP
jgi:hypothetical protein